MSRPNQHLSNKNQPRQNLAKLTILGIGAMGLLLAGIFFSRQSQLQTSGQSFTDVATNDPTHAGAALALGGSKDGGFAVGDINMDGYLDFAVNTYTNGTGTRIFIADPTDPENPTYSDQTSSYCSDCSGTYTERSAMLADINHDGLTDLIRTTYRYIFIYLNRGESDSYQLGVGSSHTPNQTIRNSHFHDSKMNTEGVMLADYDNDGWLDILIENHNYGIDVFVNSKDGNANFTCVNPTSTLLPTSATDGDYAACADIDNDGDMDLVCRKRNANDYFQSNGDGTYDGGANLDNANNSNKGGVTFADFDNDGDMDLYWTDRGENQIFLNDGSGNLNPTQSGGSDGEPWLSAGISAPSSGIDGCTTGDVNNDGKIDLFLTDDSGDSYLFLNNTPNGGSLSFARDNLGININGNGEGCSFLDYDKDGDLDLYVNVAGGSNQLWRNSLNDLNYLFVEARIDLGGGLWRSALGANVQLQDCEGNTLGGIRGVPTTDGHGTDATDWVHFGLDKGPDEIYNVVVDFVAVNGSRQQVETSFKPSDIDNHRLIVYDTDVDSIAPCNGILPVQWVSFTVQQIESQAQLSWITGGEINSSHFEVERSTDGNDFSFLGRVQAEGNTKTEVDYSFGDEGFAALGSRSIYYRIKQVDMDGAFEYSNVVEFVPENIGELFSIKLYPNPSTSEVTLEILGRIQEPQKVEVFTMDGKSIWKKTFNSEEIRLPSDSWEKGVYIVQVRSGEYRQSQQLILR